MSALSSWGYEHTPPRCVMGMPVRVSRLVPKGTLLLVDGRVYVGSEYAILTLLYGYDPLLSRNTLGMKEAERDARRS